MECEMNGESEAIHVRGYKEEGTITTPFDMTVLNDLDRFHLVMAIAR
jgi:xylulose-5-phosphate/fructose-6-phosphate phosphoketolase